MDRQQYVIYQNAAAFNWLCPKCTSDQLPFHDCSVLSSGTSDVYSNSSTLVSEYDLPPLSSTAGLRVAHLNCRSLLSITDEVSDLIVRNSIHVFALTETWLDSSIEDSGIFSYSFPINIVRNDRNRHGGGVAFLVTPGVKFVVRPDLCEGHVESIWIELFPSTKRSMLFCCAYRPPSQHNFFDNFIAECETACSYCSRLCILGDMNADLLVPSLSQTKLLLSVMRQFRLVDLVCEPTRVTMSSSSQVDVLLTTDVQCFESIGVFPFSGSDHHIIISHFYARGICVDPQPHQFVVARNFQKVDIDKLDMLLSCDDIWDEVFSSFDDVSDCLECFNLIMIGLLDLLAPLKKLRVRQQECPWLSNASLSAARRLRDVAHRRALKSGSPSDWSLYKKLRNKANTMLRLAKAEYFSGLASSLRDKPAKFWKHFQSLSKRSRSVCEGQVTVTADDFNDYFLSIPYKTVANVVSVVPPTEYMDKLFGVDVPTLKFIPVDVESVSLIVSSLHVQKASGADGLPTRFIKASPFMIRLITVLINRCIESSSVPVQWKQAIVTPVPKRRQCTGLTHFRPISVLPILSKILERVLYNQIQSHLTKYHLLSSHQPGFRADYSTQDVLLHVTDKWLRAVDEGKYTGAVFLDLAKAFDTVDHSILCTKLTYYGFRGSSYDLLCNYLVQRQQRVLFQSRMSKWAAVSIGVPQGSILGPLLFALYINDLPSAVSHCLLDLYADDAELHCSGSDLQMVENCLQLDLTSVATWLGSSRLCLNVDKSNCMLIGSRQRVSHRTLSVSVGGSVLSQVHSVRYLGVLIDSTLSWNLHICNMISRVRSRLSAITRFGSLPPAVLCILYSAFVMPLFDYCDVIWTPSTAKQTCVIERVHAKFVRKLPSSYHSKFPFTLTERRRFHTAVQIFKSLRRISPPYLHDTFQFARNVTGHLSRNINRLFVPRVFTNYGKRSFYYRGTVLWNNLKSTVTEAATLLSFRNYYLNS